MNDSSRKKMPPKVYNSSSCLTWTLLACGATQEISFKTHLNLIKEDVDIESCRERKTN